MPRKLSEEEKKNISKRMIENNPAKKFPERVNTAKPVKVYYEDGTIENYAFAKDLFYKKNIPYATIKWMIRHNKGSKRHKIFKIEQVRR
jgi:hypothetical protein